MKIDPEDVLFITNYHTRNMFYEYMVRKLHREGWTNWYIQNTSTTASYHGFTSPNIVIKDASHQNIFSGLKLIHQDLLTNPPKQKIIIHIDDDTFISDDALLKLYLQDLLEKEYACVGPYTSYSKQNFPSAGITIPLFSTLLPKAQRCKDTISDPFIGGCLSLFTTETFLSYDPSNWAENQMTMQDSGLKRGAFEVCRPISNCETWNSAHATMWTTDWFHMGNIALFWYLIQGRIGYNYKDDFFLRGASSSYHQFRIGYLMAQAEYFGLKIDHLLEKYFKNTSTTAEQCAKTWNREIARIPPLLRFPL